MPSISNLSEILSEMGAKMVQSVKVVLGLLKLNFVTALKGPDRGGLKAALPVRAPPVCLR